MNIQDAKELLSFHSERNKDVDNSKWKNGFLGSLQNFKGTLSEENFIEVMECLKVLKDKFYAEIIDREVVLDVVTIIHYSRGWATSGMLVTVLSQAQTKQLLLWCDIIEECLMYLLDRNEDAAFFVYNEYLDGRWP